MEKRNETERLKTWYENFIDYFRAEYEKLSWEEKTGINNTNNYLQPCQIEIFWIREPDQQFILLSNFKDRMDKEVIVNGPFYPKEFYEKIRSVLYSPRWQKKNESLDSVLMEYHNRDIYAEELAVQLHQFVEGFKNSLVGFGAIGGGGAIWNMWQENYAGNKADSDYKTEVEHIIKGIKAEAKRRSEEKRTPSQQQKTANKEPDGYGVHLYPPVIIGERSKLSIEQLLFGNTYDLSHSEKVLDSRIGNHIVIVNKNGYFFVESKNPTNSLRILNLVMAVGVLHDLPLFAVRENDLSSGWYDVTRQFITRRSWNPQSMRSFLFMESFQPESALINKKLKVPVEKMKEIISEADVILRSEKLVEELRLFIESYTHLQNSEYAQSFIMSWSVIERHYSEIWRQKLNQKDLDHERSGKLTNPNQWSIDYIIEVLNLNDEVDDNEYELLMELKSKRNKFYHRGKQVNKDDAERGLAISRSILSKKIASIT